MDGGESLILWLINRPSANRSKTSVLLIAVAIVLVFAPAYSDNFTGRHPHDGAMQRELFRASREGLQYGLPDQAIPKAVAKMRAMENALAAGSARAGVASKGISVPAVTQAWNFIGPIPISEKANFTGSVIGSNVLMTGRMTAVAADARGVIVAGAASGGLWVSTNNGGSFVSVFDSQPTEAIGAVALDTTTNPSTIYVGTGEGNNSIDSLYGAGVFKSSDLGQHWTALSAGTFDHASFTSMAIDTTTTPGSPRIFAGATSGFSSSRADAGIFETDASKAGLWFSPNGGNTWQQYPEPTFGGCDVIGGGNTDAPCPADDVVIDPTNPQNVYVAIDADAVYYSHNGGGTFTPASFPGVRFLEGRQSLAVGPPAPSTLGPSPAVGGVVYAMVGALDGIEYGGLFNSFDAGATWGPGTVLSAAVPAFRSQGITIDGTNFNNVSQSFYDQALLVSPTDPSTVFFGGVGLYKSAGNYGHAWTFLAPNGGIHSDQHAMVWDPANNQILLANDGGLYMFDPTQATPTFTSLNQNINASLMQSVGPHPTNATKLIAGFEGNGTQLFSGSVSGWAAPDSETGDGGFAFYDPNDPNFLYHDFSLDEVDSAVISASSDGGVTWCSAPNASIPACNTSGVPQWTPALLSLLSVVRDPGPVFYPAMAVDPKVAHRVWFGGHSVYVSTNGMATWAQQTDQDLTSDGTPEGGGECGTQQCALEDLEFGPLDGQNGNPAWSLAMSDLDGTVAFAINNTTQANVQLDSTHPHGALWSDVTQALDTLMINTNPNSYGTLSTQATSIAPDPHNSNVAYLGLSGFTSDTLVGHIYKTVDFGMTWTEADGSLPDVPVLKLLVDSTDNGGTCGKGSCSRSVYAGTDIGVFHSSDGGNSWQPFNLNSIPAVPVYDIEQNSTGVIFIGTHGRGAFVLGAASVTATPTGTPTPTATATSTSKATATATSTSKGTATPTSTSKVTPTATPTATSTSPATPSATPSPNGAKISAPASVKVASVGINLSSTKTSFTIKNAAKKGAGNLTGMVTSNTQPPVFGIAPNSFDLAPGKSQKELITFSPTMLANSATATITSNDSFGNNSLTVTLSGAGLPGKLSLPTTVTLTAKAGTTASKNLTIKNNGKGTLSGSWQSISTPPFTVTGGNFGPLSPGKSAPPIAITFAPTAKGSVTPVPLTISVTSPGAVGATVTLKGTGK